MHSRDCNVQCIILRLCWKVCTPKEVQLQSMRGISDAEDRDVLQKTEALFGQLCIAVTSFVEHNRRCE